MANDMFRFRLAAIIDRLWLIHRRGCVFGDEREDIRLAVAVLALDAANPNVDHPFIDLYHALLLATNEREVYLSSEHRRYIREAIEQLEAGLARLSP